MVVNLDRRTALLGAAAAATTLAGRDLFAGEERAAKDFTSARGLRQLADAKGLLIGAAVHHKVLHDDPRFAAALVADANVLVPEIELKWEPLEARRGTLDFAPFQAIADFAGRRDMKVRGHTLTWYRGIPQWAAAAIPTLTAAQAGDMLADYVRRVVGRTKGRVIHWDVANEPIDGRKLLTEPLWSTKLGESYLDIAFEAAHAADPEALLVFNTDLIEMDHHYHEAHRVATLELLTRLVKRGVPVQALGIEGHIEAAVPFAEGIWRKFLDEVIALGLKVIVTEFDVSDKGVMGTPAMRDQAVAATGKAFLDATFSVPQCLGMLTWSLTDRYSWLRIEGADRQRSDRLPLRPGLLDDDFRRKPLWNAVAQAIDAAPAR